MLHWLLGRPVEDANREQDNYETPETPAPVFAARALKSAIFGTPAFPNEDEVELSRQAVDMKGVSRPGAQRSAEPSPTKPQGILLTPGTATARRKTVSFGASVVDNEGKDAISKSGVPNDCPGKFPSPYTPKTTVGDNLEPARRTALTKTLEAARDGKVKRSMPIESAVSVITVASSLESEIKSETRTSSNTESQASDNVSSKNVKRDAKSTAHSNSIEDFDGDMTLDLNEPHSQSGRYWKSEYDRYHEEAKLAMEKLVKYKQLAKSYAKKKDSEAIDLGERLKEEKEKVANMEAKMSELATQIANTRLSGRANASKDSMKDLARQTALTQEYRNRVDEFQAALQESHVQVDQHSHRRGQRQSSANTAQIPNETILELSRAKERLAEMGSLRDEMHSLRLNLSMAEKKASRLQDENAKLARDLTKANEELRTSERCRQSAEAQNQEGHVLLQTLQQDYDTLKKLAKSQRRDAEDLLQKRYNQVAKLKKEIKLIKGQALASNLGAADQFTPNAQGAIIIYEEEEIAEAKDCQRTPLVEDLISFDTPQDLEDDSTGPNGRPDSNRTHRRAEETRGSFLPRSPTSIHHDDGAPLKAGDREKISLLGSKIPTLDRSKKILESTQQGNGRKVNEFVLGRRDVTYKPTSLSEITNNAQHDNSPARDPSSPINQLSTSLQERFSGLSLNSPGSALPSLEPSFALAPSRRMKDRGGLDSPRPSIFNIPSSPPKPMVPRPRSSGTDSHSGRNGNIASGRPSTMNSKVRIPLPSDRAAAAKARLEQKGAEKRKAQRMDDEKENTKP